MRPSQVRSVPFICSRKEPSRELSKKVRIPFKSKLGGAIVRNCESTGCRVVDARVRSLDRD